MDHPPTLDPEHVYHWLREHPTFFQDHPDLLPSAITASGRVFSIEAGKLDQLRRQNEQTREQLEEMMQRIRHNEEIYHAFHRVQMALLNAGELAELVRAATAGLEETFAISRVTIALCDGPEGLGLTRERRPFVLEDRLFLLDAASIAQALGSPPQPVIRVGQEGANRHLFFGSRGGEIRSEALIPLVMRSGEEVRLLGSLNLGGTVPNRFLPHYSTDLVQDLADVITLCLRKMIPVQ
nr:conserved uncharacterized protein [uncultured bacterium]